MFVLRKVKKEVRLNLVITWPAKSWSLGLSTCMKLWHYVLNSHWLHVGEIFTITSHASYLIKIPTMSNNSNHLIQFCTYLVYI